MEGISQEAISLAGAWKLNKLIALYDDNGISIDGQVAAWFADNTALRFVSAGWNVIGPIDGHDADKVADAIAEARSRPSVFAHHLQDPHRQGQPLTVPTSKTHGRPWVPEEIKLTRETLGWTAEPFVIPEDVYMPAGTPRPAAVRPKPPGTTALLPTARLSPSWLPNSPPHEGATCLPSLPRWPWTPWWPRTPGRDRGQPQGQPAGAGSLHRRLPELLGGSADGPAPTSPNAEHAQPCFDAAGAVVRTRAGVGGRHINYGVREFGMAAIANGVALHGGFIPYGGTFLTFSDYSRNAIRMAR